ncbi:MAG: 5-demethoxyubiquinol-8 5-hydroxylase UbiM [Betaproteobacteria bacterium]|nr:5-demethoxyubiquinol-8 5-hydroxylase UbiM [Betaproteobacteria bacterium]
MQVDIAITGAGPAGLSLAAALQGSGFSIALIDRLPRAALAAPPFDGREIALRQSSIANLQRLGIWDHLPAEDIAPLRTARVLNGASPQAMVITPGRGHGDPMTQATLGALVPNGEIRRAAFRVVEPLPAVTLVDRAAVSGLAFNPDRAVLTLDTGQVVRARLAIAADSRFSETRRMAGIAASMHNFGRSMMVCRMALEVDHESAAWEWFDHGQTLALLPLNGNVASAVLTLPHRDIAPLLGLDDTAFGFEMTRRFEGRLGTMRLASTRHAYPLIAVYAHRFVAPRFACVGDAAVGMHPVTAHGYNFGLGGAVALAEALVRARNAGKDWSSPAVLHAWERTHRAATRPLYVATNALARLYADESRPARALRDLALQAGRRLPLVRRALAQAVSGPDSNPPWVSRMLGLPPALMRTPRGPPIG